MRRGETGLGRGWGENERGEGILREVIVLLGAGESPAAAVYMPASLGEETRCVEPERQGGINIREP